MRGWIAFLVVLLNGCALFPLSEADCKPSDWKARGFNDGYFGHPPQDQRLASECSSRYAVTVPQTEYLAGWRDGYDEYDRLWGGSKKMK